MSLQDILNAIVDKTPFTTEAERDGIKAKIAGLGQGSESPETAETTPSGNEPGTTEEAESTTASPVAETTVPPAPETTPATEVGMGILPESAPNVEADNSEAETPAPAAPATDPSMGILTDSAPEEVPETNPTGEPAPDNQTGVDTAEVIPSAEHGTVVPNPPTEGTTSGESGSGSEASNVGS